MIPYFTLPSVHLFGPVSLQAFGVLFMLGLIFGNMVIMRRARDMGIPREEMQGALIWAFAVGLVGAHVVEILLYQPDSIRREGLSVFFNLFTGLSSIGGFFGGLLGLWVYFKRRNKPWIRHLSIVVEGFLIWWAFVRLGCTLAHDHLGEKTSFFLAINYPSGPRHNLGFYEFLVVILVLFPLTMILRRRRAQPSDYVGTILLTYGSLRFGLDFLRATDLAGADPRYWGLTAAQYGCVVLTCVGLCMLLLRSAAAKKNVRKDLGQVAAHFGTRPI
jgi:phosphatidylglycerol:prolipoprotein diacylglycerol transferase